MGVVSGIRQLAADCPQVDLALSLHAPTQDMRQRIVSCTSPSAIECCLRALRQVPSSSAFTVQKIMAAVDEYIHRSGRKVMIEYIVIGGTNDDEATAHQLGALLAGRNIFCNLVCGRTNCVWYRVSSLCRAFNGP